MTNEEIKRDYNKFRKLMKNSYTEMEYGEMFDALFDAHEKQTELDNIISTFWDGVKPTDTFSASLVYDILRSVSVEHCGEVEED